MSARIEQIISSIRQLPLVEQERLRRLLDEEQTGPNYLNENGSGDRSLKSLQWLNENRESYLGRWVSLDGDDLIASGGSAREVFDKAKAAGIKSPFVEFVTGDSSPYTGGWLS